MKIDIVSHIAPPKFKVALGRIRPDLEKHLEQVPTLYDMDRRFKIMDKYEGLKQVTTVSMTAALPFSDPDVAVDCAQRINDEQAELVQKYPDRFAAAVASVPMTDMDETLKELDRALGQLKLKGVQLFTPINNKRWDLPAFMPLFQKMCDFDLPIWIHPAKPIDRSDYGNYFIDHVFGWPYESTAFMTHLVLGGIFERLPRLKILIHHCGALVPFFDQRMVEVFHGSGTVHGMNLPEGLSRPAIDYFKMFYTDTALSGGTAGLMCGHTFFGAEKLLFGTDMPYDGELGNRVTWRTIESVEKMAVSEADKQMIFADNAKKLLGLEE
ncbi:MAG: amidohydrolase family protein [Desulfobacterales bacterium]|nr:amidohydrolase family protein [Desulfobacterales bacterium]